jgi:hypothetical protein
MSVMQMTFLILSPVARLNRNERRRVDQWLASAAAAAAAAAVAAAGLLILRSRGRQSIYATDFRVDEQSPAENNVNK